MGKEIKILGAGPAGLAAAITLAKNGVKVTVFEKNFCVGNRFNGDFQGIENWTKETDVLKELEQFGIKIGSCSVSFRDFTFFNEKFQSGLVKSREPLIYLVKRGEMPGTLDRTLLEQALAAGAIVRFNQKIPKSDVDIVATGPQGKPTGIARGITFDTDFREFGCVSIDQNLSPGGYTYFLSSAGSATIATVLLRDFPRASECLWNTIDKYRQIFGLKVENAREWGARGNFSFPSTDKWNGKIFVGEAAGFQDKLFGFGIRMALTSGILAAMSILEGRQFDTLWRNELLRFMKTSQTNRFIFENLSITRQVFWQMICNAPNPRSGMGKLYSWRPI